MSDFNDYDYRYNNFEKNKHNKHNYDMNNYNHNNDVISIGTWILVLIGTAIPFINFILLIGLAIGSGNESLKNYGKAALILVGIVFIFAIFTGVCSS